jgi:4'-phosphopantetheinyl transferase
MKFANRANLLEALKNEAHVWLAYPEKLSDSKLQDFFLEILSEDEIEKYNRFRFSTDRHLYLVSHALIRIALSNYIDLDPDKWRFIYNKFGRPEIHPSLGVPFLRFNLSHTQGLVSCLVVLSIDAGVDIENHTRFNDLDTLPQDVFSSSEFSCLDGMPEEEKKERFFTYWTLKEAFLKGRGMGLAFPLNQISFHLKTGEPISVSFDLNLQGNTLDWQFAHFRPTSSHSLAVALCRGNMNDLKIKFWEVLPGPKDLLAKPVKIDC